MSRSRPAISLLEVVRVRLPLVEPWTTSAGTITARDALLVRVVMGGVEGWGECVAQSEPTYSAEYVEGAADVLRRHLAPRLLAAAVSSAAEVAPALAAIKGHPMAKASLEAAVLDAELRATGVSLADHLFALSTVPAVPGLSTEPAAATPPGSGSLVSGVGKCTVRQVFSHQNADGPPVGPQVGPPPGPPTGRPDRVRGGVAVGIAGSVPALVDEVGRRVGEGYRRVKLKVHPGWDVAPLSAVRDAFPDLALQVDANGAYASLAPAESRRALRDLDRFELLMVEQPLGDDDLVGHAALARSIATPICLDEAITSRSAAATALELGACGVVNIKAGRVGGYLEAVRIHDLCAAAGIPVWCGGMLETGIGRAANLALATLPGFVLPGDLSASGRFWAADIVTPPARLEPDGTIAVPDGPGIGVEVGDLRAWTVTRLRLG